MGVSTPVRRHADGGHDVCLGFAFGKRVAACRDCDWHAFGCDLADVNFRASRHTLVSTASDGTARAALAQLLPQRV